MPKNCGCGGGGTSGSSGQYVISVPGMPNKTFRSQVAAEAFVAMTPGAEITSAPAPVGG